ncbi:MAG: hypothetical protein M1268_00405 [Patescibacteria group bacterium]|nr:hypothetical protein [Patescibacteria group bacterium]
MEGQEAMKYYPKPSEKKGPSTKVKVASGILAGLALLTTAAFGIKKAYEGNQSSTGDLPDKTPKTEHQVVSLQTGPELIPDPNFPKNVVEMYKGPATEVLDGAVLTIKKGNVNFRKDGPFKAGDDKNRVSSESIRKINGVPVGDVIVIRNPAIIKGQNVDGAGGDEHGDWVVVGGVDGVDLKLQQDQEYLYFSLSSQTDDYWELKWDSVGEGKRSDIKNFPANQVNIVTPKDQILVNK